MKKTSTKILICALAMMALMVVFAGCDKYKPDHYDHLITFNYNVGVGLTNSAPQEQYLGVLDGGIVSVRPGGNNQIQEAQIKGYYIEDWYLPLLDEDGNIQKDENQVVLLQAEPYDFKNTRVHSSFTLYAKLKKSPVLYYMEVDDEGNVLGEVGSMDGLRPGNTRSKPSDTSSSAPHKDGYTFLGEYYTDPTCTEVFEWSHVNDRGDTVDRYLFTEEPRTEVYVKFIEGQWTLVRTKNELDSAININANIYLLNDIVLETTDSRGRWVQNWTPRNFNGVLNGNHHKISNVQVQRGASKQVRTNFAIFGVLGARAHIYDITFNNVDVRVSYDDTSAGVGINTAVFAAGMREGLKLENVVVSGAYSVNYKNFNESYMTVYDFIVDATEAQLQAFKGKGCNWDGVEQTLSGLPVAP